MSNAWKNRLSILWVETQGGSADNWGRWHTWWYRRRSRLRSWRSELRSWTERRRRRKLRSWMRKNRSGPRSWRRKRRRSSGLRS